jgi:hypothetical protein
MAAAAILPPMFFERHRLVSLSASSVAFSGTPLKQHQRNSTAGVISPATRDQAVAEGN